MSRYSLPAMRAEDITLDVPDDLLRHHNHHPHHQQHSYPSLYSQQDNTSPHKIDDPTEDRAESMSRSTPTAVTAGQSSTTTTAAAAASASSFANSLIAQTLNADGTPKRPMNAFMIFARKRRPEVAAQNQMMRTGEISKILSKEWSGMDMSQKQFYLDLAKRLKDIFNARYPDYVYRRRPNNSRKRRRGSDGSLLPANCDDGDLSPGDPSPDSEDDSGMLPHHAHQSHHPHTHHRVAYPGGGYSHGHNSLDDMFGHNPNGLSTPPTTSTSYSPYPYPSTSNGGGRHLSHHQQHQQHEYARAPPIGHFSKSFPSPGTASSRSSASNGGYYAGATPASATHEASLSPASSSSQYPPTPATNRSSYWSEPYPGSSGTNGTSDRATSNSPYHPPSSLMTSHYHLPPPIPYVGGRERAYTTTSLPPVRGVGGGMGGVLPPMQTGRPMSSGGNGAYVASHHHHASGGGHLSHTGGHGVEGGIDSAGWNDPVGRETVGVGAYDSGWPAPRK